MLECVFNITSQYTKELSTQCIKIQKRGIKVFRCANQTFQIKYLLCDFKKSVQNNKWILDLITKIIMDIVHIIWIVSEYLLILNHIRRGVIDGIQETNSVFKLELTVTVSKLLNVW